MRSDVRNISGCRERFPASSAFRVFLYSTAGELVRDSLFLQSSLSQLVPRSATVPQAPLGSRKVCKDSTHMLHGRIIGVFHGGIIGVFHGGIIGMGLCNGSYATNLCNGSMQRG